MSDVSILNCKFKAWTLEETVKQIESLIQSDKRDYMCTVNSSILIMMRSNPRLANFISKSNMVIADGQPVVWLSKCLKQKSLPNRVAGIDVLAQLPKLAENKQWGIYLVGATDEIINTVVKQYQKDYPKLVISGYHSGYFNADESKKIAQEINDSGAKILIVAMGVPRQEYFVDDNWGILNVNFAIGVGGSFDVISGFTKRAPGWMQKAGLEWLYRTIQEPRRLFLRYLVTNTQFIYLSIKEIISSKKKTITK